MNASMDQHRRAFLRFSGMATAVALLIPWMPLARAGTSFSTIPRPGEVLSEKTVMLVAYATSLREPNDSFELHLGSWSDPFKTRDGRLFRVQVTKGPPVADPRLGPSFTLVLADGQGAELSRMNLGNSATGTFTDYGIQFYIARL